MSAIPAPVRAAGNKWLPVVLALGRVETRKLLGHPAAITGALLALAVPVVVSWNDVPVLNRYDALAAESLIPFGCGVLIAAHLGTMRARRHRTTELFESVVAPESLITAAHLVAGACAAAAALGLVLTEFAYLKAIGGVGVPRPEVALGGPALIAFAAALGVALGRWAPRLFAGPLALAGIVGICSVLATNPYAHNREFLSLWVPSEVAIGTVGEFSLRPHGPRLVYVTGLALVAAAAAFAQHRRHRIVAAAAVLIAAAGTAYAGMQAMQEVPRATKVARAEAALDELAERRCRELGSVRYCAFDGYESWIERWREPVEGVLTATPAAARPDDLGIAQLPGEDAFYYEGANDVLGRRIRREKNTSPTDVNPTFSWGRHSDEGKSELAVALATAVRTTAIDTRFRLTGSDLAGIQNPKRFGLELGRRYRYCMTLDQGRSIVAMWLAAQATPGAEATFRSAYAESPYLADPDDGGTYFDPQWWGLDQYLYETVGGTEVSWGTREAAYAIELLRRDDGEVRAAIATDWDRLTDPATTSDEAATILGLSPLPPLKVAIDNWDFFRRYRGLEQFGMPQCH